MNKLIFKLFYSKLDYLLIFLISALFLSSCATITGNATKQILNETGKNPEVYFCPKDDCSKVFEKIINSANFSVHCALYNINLKNVINSLAKKSKTAEVMVVMDNSNDKRQIKGDGVRFDNNKQLMHNKFCVIDNHIVITGSFNPTENDNFRNNNNVIVVYSKALAKNYQDEFRELWNGEFGKGKKTEYPILYLNNRKIENYFCPEDDCASHVIDTIKKAEKSIYFMTFSFTNEGIADELIEKDNLEIKGIFDEKQSSIKFSQFKRLQEFGINVKKSTNKYTMHHKVFIIDNETVVTGSFNPTESADTKNDENLLIVHDKQIANAFLKEFDSLW